MMLLAPYTATQTISLNRLIQRQKLCANIDWSDIANVLEGANKSDEAVLCRTRAGEHDKAINILLSLQRYDAAREYAISKSTLLNKN